MPDARDPARTADRAGALDQGAGVPEASYEALAGRYGHDAERVLAIASERRQNSSAVLDGLPDLLAEIVYAVRHEQARSAGDALLRRTRLGVLAGRSICAEDSPVPGAVTRAIAAELGWDGVRAEYEAGGIPCRGGRGGDRGRGFREDVVSDR